MYERTQWGQRYNQPTKGCSAEEGPIRDLLKKKVPQGNGSTEGVRVI
jgi:hypothetical protein